MKVLIAEDDATSRLILGTTLKKLGHEVVESIDGQAALELYRQNSFDVVITDWMMPTMDGVDLCKAIRQNPRQDYTYILILTALSGKGRFLEGMDAGADDYVTKPFDPDELAARLRVASRILGLEHRMVRLEGLLPICSYCKKIRDENERWTQMEQYVASRSKASFSHSICPSCYETRFESEIAAWEAARK